MCDRKFATKPNGITAREKQIAVNNSVCYEFGCDPSRLLDFCGSENDTCQQVLTTNTLNALQALGGRLL